MRALDSRLYFGYWNMYTYRVFSQTRARYASLRQCKRSHISEQRSCSPSTSIPPPLHEITDAAVPPSLSIALYHSLSLGRSHIRTLADFQPPPQPLPAFYALSRFTPLPLSLSFLSLFLSLSLSLSLSVSRLARFLSHLLRLERKRRSASFNVRLSAMDVNGFYSSLPPFLYTPAIFIR